MVYRFLLTLPAILFTLLSTICAMSLIMAKHAYDARHSMKTELSHNIDIKPPASKPPLNQASIDIALVIFDIEVPYNVNHPRFNPTLEDRGLTTLRWGRKLEVTIGPAAFSSWGLLGSTLAHELEVHCRQNFALIRLQDILGMEGTSNAERAAYEHELANAARFYLDPIEQRNIQATMDFYYPLPESKDSFSAR